MHNADGPCADDKHGVARVRAIAFKGVVHAGKRFGRRRLVEIAAAASTHTLPCRTAAAGMSTYSAKAPSRWMPSARYCGHIWVLPLTQLSHRPQPIFGITATACPSWYPSDAFSQLFDDTRHLMTENERRTAALRIAPHADIGAADGGTVHFSTGFPQLQARGWAVFHAKLLRPAQNGGFHQLQHLHVTIRFSRMDRLPAFTTRTAIFPSKPETRGGRSCRMQSIKWMSSSK